MKNLIAGLLTVMTASSAVACLGSGTLQVVLENNGEKLVVANYDARTGDRLMLSPKVSYITAVNVHGGNACTSEKLADCTQLAQMKNDDVVFIISLKNSIKLRAKVVSSVTVDSTQVAMAKGGAPGLDIGADELLEKDIDGTLIAGCSQK